MSKRFATAVAVAALALAASTDAARVVNRIGRVADGDTVGVAAMSSSAGRRGR